LRQASRRSRGERTHQEKQGENFFHFFWDCGPGMWDSA
jgi:hypothetical protein